MRRGLSELIKVGHVRGAGEYFHEVDAELIEQSRASEELLRDQAQLAEAEQRRATELDRERVRIAKVLQISDPEILSALQALDYTPDTAQLLFLTPLLRLAWLDGTVSHAERALVLRIATEHGLQLDTGAYTHLQAWLDRPPREKLLEGSWSVIRTLLRRMPAGERRSKVRGLLLECRAVGALTSGILKHKTSAAERDLLHAMEQELTEPQPESVAAPAPDLGP